MGCLSWVFVGLIAGSLARLLQPGIGPRGCLLTVLLGIAGGWVGGYLGAAFGFGAMRGFDLRTVATATFGALILLAVSRLFQREN